MKLRLQEDIKHAMRAREQANLKVLRTISAAIKQVEIDQRIELSTTECLKVLRKMIKQRHDAHAQYTDAGRDDLATQEQFEIDIISTYLPVELSEEVLTQHIHTAITESGATSLRDMGSVMSTLQNRLQGQADMQKVSQQVKQLLATIP